MAGSSLSDRPLLLIGGSGQLGQALLRQAEHLGIRVVAPSRKQLDLAAPEPDLALEPWLEDRPGAILLAAAFTAVDDCEVQPDLAWRVNAQAPGLLARRAGQSGIPLIMVSTDYVFGEHPRTPCLPDDPPRPLNVYGQSKLKGEQEVLAAGALHRVVRTSWLYGHGGRNFPLTILNAAARGAPLRVVDDQWGSPTNCTDLAGALLQMAPGPPVARILHYTNSGACSWHTFAVTLLRLAGWNAPVAACRSHEFPRPAHRPAYAVLDCGAAREAGLATRPWAQALSWWLNELREAQPGFFPCREGNRGAAIES